MSSHSLIRKAVPLVFVLAALVQAGSVARAVSGFPVLRDSAVGHVASARVAPLAMEARPPQGPAGLNVINFDDLTAGGPQGGVGPVATVNDQYAAQGVTFNDAWAVDYSKGPFALPGFAHSGTVGVEQCFAVEFCTTPIAASFTAPQQRVGVWVGFSTPLSVAVTVQLTALDASSTVVGSASATLPANAAVTPIQTPLEVDSSSANITRLEVSIPGGFDNFLAVDDVEFSTVGPPPPCNATSVPAVRFDLPASGLVVQNNEFLFQGSVDNGGSLITSADIRVVDPTLSVAALFPRLIGPTGGPFGPVRAFGLLNKGPQKLIVTATNCLGTGGSQAVLVEWRPIPDGTHIRMWSLEVVQTVQDTNNTVPLVAATANAIKRTFVRVYLAAIEPGPGSQPITDVTGTLTARREGGSLPGGPVSVASLNAITVDPGYSFQHFQQVRSSLDSSLNFELPREWLQPGRLHLQVDLKVESESVSCEFCENPGPTGDPALVTFHRVPPLRLWLVGIPYMTGTGPSSTVVTPRQFDFDMLASWLRRAFPSADVQITQANMATLAAAPADCNAVNALLSQWAARAHDSRTRFYGLIPDNHGNHFVNGCAAMIPGRYGSGPAGRVLGGANPWDLDGSYADVLGAHEIAHMYGRNHPGFCNDQVSFDPNYPYPGGLIGSPVPFPDFLGLDAGDAALSLPLRLYDWRASWTDLMTYCRNQWISDYTYRGILENLCAADHDNCPDYVQLGAPARAAERGPRRRSRGLAVSITGTLALGTGKLVLNPLWATPGLTLTAPTPGGTYAIEMRDADGKLLASDPFQPQEESDPPSASAAKALIDEVVPFPAGTRRIVIAHGAQTLASLLVSAHAPTVHFLSANAGQLNTTVRLRWTSHDADGNRRWYTLLYSPDGKQFMPLATDLTRTSLLVDLTGLPGGSRARFEVIASDGVRTGSALSPSFAVPVKPPRVAIDTPKNQASFNEGESISFAGTASDLQDGELQASQLVWSSSLQGVLGSGSAITAILKPGTHVITLTATNRAGKTAAAITTITVKAVPPLLTLVPIVSAYAGFPGRAAARPPGSVWSRRFRGRARLPR